MENKKRKVKGKKVRSKENARKLKDFKEIWSEKKKRR